jgi:hypothetical protein
MDWPAHNGTYAPDADKIQTAPSGSKANFGEKVLLETLGAYVSALGATRLARRPALAA